MAVIVDSSTRLLIQGITGYQARFHSREMQKAGTVVLAGTSPGKGGQEVNGIPVYDSVREAVSEHPEINTSIVMVPALYAMDAFFEAVDAGIGTVVVITEHIPVHDEMKMARYARYRGVRLVGPNCPGVASPGKAKVGIIPNIVQSPGNVGVVSRSGTLTYEIVYSLTKAGLGQSSCVGIGGDRVSGTSFRDVLELFREDEETEAVVMVGEIGGTAEEDAAEYIKGGFSKPVVAYIAGLAAPPGKRMGHAGAIITGGKGTYESKVKSLEEAGVVIARSPADIPGLVERAMKA